jgi:tetratricopeptide (TPR) repeat protein
MKRTCLFILITLFSSVYFLPVAEATFPGKAISHWYLKETKDHKDPDYEKVRELVREKKLKEAMAALDEKIKNSPKATTAIMLKGLLHNEMGEYGKALNVIMAESRREQKHPAVHFGYCQIYRNLGNIKLSERACTISSQQHYQVPEAHYEYAQTLAIQGKMPTALKELQTAAKLDPKNVQYPIEMGMIALYLDQNDEAEKYFLQALSLDPENLDAAYEIAYLYATQKKSELAKKYIYQILETRRIDPKLDSAKLLLGYINKNNEDKLNRKVTPHLYHLSRSQSYYQAGKYGLSLIEVQTAARLKPDDLKVQEILIGMSSVLFRLDLEEKTIHSFIELVKGKDALQGKAYQELGDIRVTQGKLEEARQFYEKAKSLGDPGNFAKITLAQFPDASAADPSLYNPNELFTRPTDALNRKGEIFAHYKMYDRAIAIYSMVTRMDPQHLDSVLNTATAYYQSGKNGRAISILERLLVTHPSHDHILTHRFLLAQAYVKKGDVDGGLKNIRWILKRNPEMKNTVKASPVFQPLQENTDFIELVK